MVCANVVGENNGTKREAIEREGSMDVVLTFGGGVDSLKPSLCKMMTIAEICGKNIAGNTISGVGSEEMTCNDST